MNAVLRGIIKFTTLTSERRPSISRITQLFDYQCPSARLHVGDFDGALSEKPELLEVLGPNALTRCCVVNNSDSYKIANFFSSIVM